MFTMLQTDQAEHAEAAGHAFLPHGYCYLWNERLLLTHLISDVLIGLAYVCIAFSLAWLVHRARRDIPFGIAFVAFGLFIVTCGLTHFMEVWTIWQPVYWLSGFVKAVTAVASVATAIAMPFWVPRVHTTIQEAKLARDRAVAEERARVLEDANKLLRRQAGELERQRERAEAAAVELERANAGLREAVQVADEARRVAEHANSAKARFLAVMSHELRTPLNAVIGYADLLAAGVPEPASAAQIAHLDRINRSATHLIGLIDDILEYARIEAGRERIQHAWTDAGAVALEAATQIEPEIRARNLAFRLDLPDLAIPLFTDPGRLLQILLNLLSNAVKNTSTGEIVLRVLPEGDAICFEVSDTGSGIPEEHRSQIFEPFWQGEPARTRKKGGAGLGLSVAQRLVTALGGRLELTRSNAEGSVFRVWLPRDPAV